jgi:methenyltetrahydromethanopterin cyclohydrolase
MTTTAKENQLISLNQSVYPLVEALIRDAAAVRVGSVQMDNGTTLIDAGIQYPGSLEAGRRIGEICMAALGSVRLVSQPVFADWPWQVEVVTHQPMLACLGSQYAGWSLSLKEENYHALGSGPARSLAQKEPLFAEIGYRDQAERTCLVLETDRYPPLALAEKVCNDCHIAADDLTLILTPTGSPAGVVQIAARVVEVALHKAHELDFPVNIVCDGLGCTPLPPPIKDSLTAMGRTNDTILFGGQVHLFVSGPDDQAEALANGLPSSNSRDYGKPFAQVFSDYQYDFFKIDPMLFSPAKVAVTAIESGRTFHAGKLDNELLMRSFVT